MSDIRRSILWVIFGFSLVLLWDQWQIHNGRQATFFPTQPPATAQAPAQPGASNAAVPAGQGHVTVETGKVCFCHCGCSK